MYVSLVCEYMYVCLYACPSFGSYGGYLPLVSSSVVLVPIIYLLLEVEVSDMSAYETVLKADTKRLKLLAEEERLLAEAEAGDDSNTDRLKEVVPLSCLYNPCSERRFTVSMCFRLSKTWRLSVLLQQRPGPGEFSV